MELEFLQSNIANPAVLLPAIRNGWRPYFEQQAFLQLDPLNPLRKINDTRYRPDKLVDTTSGEDNKGEPIRSKKAEKVSRIAIPLQALIVERLVAFITGGGVTLSAKPTDSQKPLFEGIKDVWSNNKLDFRNGAIVRALLSQLECAEVWYSKNDNGKVKLRFKVYAPADGFLLMPSYDATDDLVAFSIEYQRKNSDGETITYHDLFTDTQIIRHQQDKGVDTVIEAIDHGFGKIPVVYYQQDRSVWQNVQRIIDRLEVVISNFCDTNDYFAAPVLAVIGEIMGLAEKGETGKAVQLENGADAKYITWTQVPEAIKYEIETLVDQIYSCVQCPNISFNEMKKLGGLSGVAFDRVMIDAHLKARTYHNGIYGEGVQRRLNFLVSAQANIMDLPADLDITPKFRLFRIDDQMELVKMWLLANGNQPLASLEDAVEGVQLSDNPAETIKEIKAYQAEQALLVTMKAGHAQDTSANGIAGSKTKTDNAVTGQITRNKTTNAQNAAAA